MKLDKAGIDFLKVDEAFRNEPYADKKGLPTIGWGHVILPNENFTVITAEQGEEILRKDCALAESCVDKMVKAPLNQNQFNALVSFVFNAGCRSLTHSTLLRELNNGNYGEAANQFGSWIFCDGKPCEGLINRRAREKALFLSKKYA